MIAGTRMSNLCFNLAQREPGDELTGQDLATMKLMQIEWDDVVRRATT